ncbi:MAG: Ldh family oxidoreductase [Desulfurococcaceae archaeon]
MSLRDYVSEVFRALGVTREHAEITADVLVTADLMGIESHGVQRLKRYTIGIKIGSVNTEAKVEVVKETPTTALIDGGGSLGQVVSYKATKTAIEKAKANGISVVGVRNSHHFGIAGYYALQAVKENMIGIVMTNSEPLISYTHTIGRNIGTNPIAVGFPTRTPPPILFDAATSIVPIGKIEVYAKQGKKNAIRMGFNARWKIN